MGFFESPLQIAALIIIGLCLLFLALKIPRRRIKLLGRVVLNCAVGMVLLTLINTMSFWTQLALPVNAVSVTASAILGAPGVLAMAAIKLFVL